MLERTDTGFKITFTTDNPLYSTLERGVVALISDIWDLVVQLPFTKERVMRAGFAYRLIQTVVFYMEEVDRSTDNSAFFAAGCIGTSALEGILILACIRHQSEVVQTPAWKKFARKNKKHGQLFADIVFWIQLNDLIGIGQELGWFPADNVIQSLFAFEGGWPEAIADIPSLKLTPSEAIHKLQSFRNLLHPGRSLREKVNLQEQVGKDCLALLYVCLGGVLQYHSGPEVDFLEYAFPKPIKDLIDAVERLTISDSKAIAAQPALTSGTN